MELVSSRHMGDLGGKLRTFDPDQAVTIEIAIDPDLAHTASVQHAAWMLVNLLTRAEGIASRIQVHATIAAPVHERTIPFGQATDLVTRLLEAGSAIGVVPVTGTGAAPDRTIIIGRRHPTRRVGANDLVLLGAGWWGAITFGATELPHSWAAIDTERREPIGPYIAACLAAANVFLRIRDPRIAEVAAANYGWNAWTTLPEATPSQLGPALAQLGLGGVGLAGVGAVGAAWMHTIWATPGLTGRVDVVDADVEGVSASNLNRGLLFRRSDVGAQKASTAANAAHGGVEWAPIQGKFEAQSVRPQTLISAVDTNNARDALQALYSPQILSASTQDLRAEVNVGGSPGIGACLRCFNVPESVRSDDELRRQAQRDGKGIAVAIAAAIGTDAADVQRRLAAPGCDMISNRMLAQLRHQYGASNAPAAFAVGFNSAMAGVMLAAETIRLHLDPSTRPTGATTRTSFQFRRPDSSLNGSHPYLRDSTCPKCAPSIPVMELWRSRRDAWHAGTRNEPIHDEG